VNAGLAFELGPNFFASPRVVLVHWSFECMRIGRYTDLTVIPCSSLAALLLAWGAR
jgi:hypothetical protein